MIIVENLYKRYQTLHGPGRWVLEDVSFVIPRYVSVGIVGKNGAGKSTLLNLIGGTDTPNRGYVEHHCRVSWPMGFAGGFQGSLTGRQNVKFVCRIHGYDDQAIIEDRIAFIQDFAEIGQAFDEPIKTYSAGMLGRLKFGLSLAFDFDVYISDELATSTGDASFKNKASNVFENLRGKSNIIMASHSEGTLKEFCTAGIWVENGHAHWFDDVKDALNAYKASIQQ